jgi:tetratricopeptide (TPR) repeat protein
MDISYTIDPETLREIPNYPDQMRQALIEYQHKADQSTLDFQTRIEAMGLVGTLARILGELIIAHRYLTQAIEYAESYNAPKYVFINRIRLAHTYQWMGDYTTSTEMFKRLLEAPLEGYQDFLLQHAGKNAFDEGDYVQAILFFQQALKVRLEKGNPELIASTQMAIRAAEKRWSSLSSPNASAFESS